MRTLFYTTILLLFSFTISSQDLIVDGKVGIATTAALAPLHVKGNNEALRIEGTQPWLSFYNGATRNGYLQHDGQNMWLVNNQDGNINFVSNNITTNTNQSDFMIRHVSGSSANHGFSLKNNGVNGRYWTFYVKNSNGDMTLGQQGGINGTFSGGGYFSAFSFDKRLNKNIKALNPVLSRLLSLNPLKYDYIASGSSKKSIGFIAQDVKDLFPELVLYDPMDDGEVVLQVNYAGFGVLAIKAIQEQQEMIEDQAVTINTLELKMEELIRRIAILEN